MTSSHRPFANLMGLSVGCVRSGASPRRPANLVMGPGDETMAHNTDEHGLVPRIAEAVELHTEIAGRRMRVAG
jgi:hypothetical protein